MSPRGEIASPSLSFGEIGRLCQSTCEPNARRINHRCVNTALDHLPVGHRTRATLLKAHLIVPDKSD